VSSVSGCTRARGVEPRSRVERLAGSIATGSPTGEKARAVKARYVGVCRGCGAYTQPRNGKGDAYAYCKACHPGAIEQRWTRELVISAMLEWRDRYGRLPSSYDWSRPHAHRRGSEPLERLSAGDWPSASAVSGVFGGWKAARAAAANQIARADEDRPSPEHLRDDVRPAGREMQRRPTNGERRTTVQETAAQSGIEGWQRCI
jgi:hypothetical protein